MSNEYMHFSENEITKEVLDSIEVGDLIKINDWKIAFRVKAVSKNYFVMARNMFKHTQYSVCEKKPWGGIRYNSMLGGRYHCGTDNFVFGHPLCLVSNNLYKFENEEVNKEYLESFENGECELSARTSVAIFDLYIKKKGNTK